MNKEDKFILELNPFQALQLLRFKVFIEEAINDPDNYISKTDGDGIKNVFNEIESQIYGKMSIKQLDDAVAEREVKKMLNE